MKYKLFMLLLFPALALNAITNESAVVMVGSNVPKVQITDSMSLNLREVVVFKSMRENAFINKLPVSSSSLSGEQMDVLNAQNVRSLSVYVPNLYVPDYGSKITSAVYIRGIGSRLNTSVVGFYVDNIPYLDKSAFDFELQDIRRVDVLRGPQGTLYGRNSMGGLIHIQTNSPFDNPGSTLRLSYGSYNDLKVQLSHSKVLNPHLAFLVSANYNKRDGFVKNAFTGENCDSQESAGARTKLAARFSNGWKADLSANYEYSMQDGYSYAPYGQSNPVVSYNDPTFYGRNLFSTGLVLEKQCKSMVFSSMTGYQYFDDNLKLDQDFSTDTVFTLNQKQKQNALTQEFVLKSNDEKPFQWVVGAFGFYKNLRTDSPVQFKQGGIRSLLEDNINRNSPIKVDITDEVLNMPNLFKEENYSMAIYHQSTYHFQNLKGLSATAGLRLDYENVALDYNSSASMNYNYAYSGHGRSLSDVLAANSLLDGKESKGFWQVIPKVSLQYEINKCNRVYASVSKGYQSGGYNIQIFSDLIQSELQGVMSQQMKQSMAGKLQTYVDMGMMTQATVDAFIANIPDGTNVENVGASISYDPEFSWNYELGFHAEPIEGILRLDAALFYIDCHDRQIAQFSPNGFGRMMKNASGSFSKGFEISMLVKPVKNMGLNASYGFTEAKFTDYKDSVRINGAIQEVDYSGNYVSMVPKHTLSLGADYTLIIQKCYLENIVFSAQYTAAGPIFWTEKNNLKQDLYGLADGQISFVKGYLRLGLWSKNILNQQYNTFYFESLGKSFAQQAKPRQFGLTAQWRF